MHLSLALEIRATYTSLKSHERNDEQPHALTFLSS